MASNTTTTTTSTDNAQKTSLPVIKKLPPSIINKIAAGEVIQYPASMAKELLENSLDAGANRITIKVQNGGLEKFIISDNGHGIRKEDLPVVCQRHTTSKLSSVEDLSTIGTFGFRGEALASVSCVAQVRITSKTQDQQCAYRATFMNNEIFPQGEEPTPIAGSNGTTIEVERLFHDNQIRFQAQKHSQELKRLVTCLRKYALQNHGVQFTLKKMTSNRKDEMIFSTSTNTNFKKNLRILYGKDVAKSIMSAELEGEHFECTAHFTNPKYSNSHSQFIIFINNRLVKCPKLKRDVESLFEGYLPHRKKPFVHLSLKLDPSTIDVNCHPAKEQVGFIHEDEIIEAIRDGIKEKLIGSDDARVMYAQQALPYTSATGSGGGASAAALEGTASQHAAGIQISTPTITRKVTTGKVYDYNKVRSTQKDQVGDMEKYLITPKRPRESMSGVNLSESSQQQKRIRMEDGSAARMQNSVEVHQGPSSAPQVLEDSARQQEQNTSEEDEEGEIAVVLELLERVEYGSPPELKKLIYKHVYVGWVTPRMVLFQHETALYSIDPVILSRTLFYQIFFRRIKTLGRMRLKKPLSIRKLLSAVLGEEECQSCLEVLKWGYVAELLSLYYSLDIDTSPEDDCKLVALPIALKNYMPPMHRLPTLIYQLAQEVEWRNEKECFHDTATYLAEFYELCHEDEVIPQDPSIGDSQYEDDATPSQMEQQNPLQDSVLQRGYTHAALKWVTQHVIFDALRKKFLYVPPSNLPEIANIQKLASLSSLYKVFERC